LGRLIPFKRPPKTWRNTPPPQRGRSAPPWLPLALLIAAAAAWQFLQPPPPDGAIPGDDGKAVSGPVRVGDGDSIDIGETRIRFHGIDAVELAQHCRDASGQDYACGEEAKRTLQNLIGSKTVRCGERHGVDQYGRIAAVCTADGLDLNAAMVDSGFAVAYRQHSLAYVPNENRAKAAKKGLWAGSFEMPWDYRRE
jgi:endonuclease YncB( thermonuclease family)